MSMDLTGIRNRNEYYTNHYFASIFEENAADTIRAWREAAQGTDQRTPWALLRDAGKRYFLIRGRQERRRGETAYAEAVSEIARDLMTALGYDVHSAKPELEEIPNVGKVPVALGISKENGAPLLWTILTAPTDSADLVIANDDETDASDILGYVPMAIDMRPGLEMPFKEEQLLRQPMEELLGRLLYDLDESPRWIILISENQIALIDRNKWNEKRFLVFDLDDIFGRNEESTLQAMAVLLHRDSLCPKDGGSLLDVLDDNSHKHASGVSRDLKYALRQCIEILGNEVVYDMKERQHVAVFGRALAEDLTLQCLRYMYRILFMLFIEAKPELGYAPMKAQTYESGYSFESLREICEQAQGDGEINEEGNFLKESLDKLFDLVYSGFPTKMEATADSESLQGVFAIEPLKAHIFDPERTALIEKAHLRNGKLLQIINLMSLSRGGKGQRRGRISYSNLGVNQLGAVYEALLSYRGFFAEEDLYEVKRAGDKVDELDVGYFIPLRDLDQYTEDERVRNDDGTLRVHPKGEFIYRLAGREREKSASYYTPEVLTRCLVKYALKELLEDKSADDILELTICEPAMGSAAFLNEAVSQLAEAYLERKQKETGVSIPHEQRQQELQKVKMLIADRNVYGIDLNPTAVELAEVSLWLNTIYQGGYVPWFRTQIVNGNSLIGARRQCYTLSQAQAEGAGAWYNTAPERVAPGMNRSLRKQQVYHFLLGDPGMCAYTDKVIKELEPEKIAAIKKWNKNFTKPLTDSEADDVLRLCNQIDALWDAHTQLRAEIKDKTTDPLSVWGQAQDEEHQPTTIRDKDRIYDSLYLSKGGNNASPYARLKAVMDYWCALWFWPIDKADELPNRMEFLWDVNMLLGVGVVDTSGNRHRPAGQLSMFDDLDLDPYARELSDRYGKYGAVNLDQLRADFPRLRIANEVAEQQKFFHWELEFSDVFEERGGFDLVVGNPPWIKIEWNEQAVLGDRQPLFAVRKFSATQAAQHRAEELKDNFVYELYFSEYEGIIGQQSFLNALQNYPLLMGMKANLYKCFIPIAWYAGSSEAIIAFIHPEGVYEEPNGNSLRNALYPKLRKHFQFVNERLLFQEVSDTTIYGLNIYGNRTSSSFDHISSLYDPITIDDSYSDDDKSDKVPEIKDEQGNWNIKGHSHRVVRISRNNLKVIAKLFHDGDKAFETPLPSIYSTELFDVLLRLSEVDKKIGDLDNDVFMTQYLNETISQKKRLIEPSNEFPCTLKELIYAGPYIGVGNPFYKTPRSGKAEKADYDRIDLFNVGKQYIQRSVYKFHDISLIDIPLTPWGTQYTEEFRLVVRRRLGMNQERTLMGAIIPCGPSHINGVFGLAFKKQEQLVYVAALLASLPYDYYVRSLGKGDLLNDTASKFPLPQTPLMGLLINRALLLNCGTEYYKPLWDNTYRFGERNDSWAKNDDRLQVSFPLQEWTDKAFIRNDFTRHQALVEIDVLVAMSIHMTLNELKNLYRLQFPVHKKYEDETWYDALGRIVFTTNKGIPNVGFSRAEWESGIKGAPAGKKFYRTIIDDTQPGGPVQRTIEYVAPFDRCDREKDYETAWEYFSRNKA